MFENTALLYMFFLKFFITKLQLLLQTCGCRRCFAAYDTSRDTEVSLCPMCASEHSYNVHLSTFEVLQYGCVTRLRTEM